MSTAKPAPQTSNGLNRFNLILIILLIVQAAILAFVFWPKSANTATSQLALADANADTINRLDITDDQGNQITLAKNDTGWILPEAGNYPVLQDKVTPLLSKFGALETDRLVTRTSDSHRRLQVAPDKFMRQVTIQTESNNSYTLYLGTSAGSQTNHIRLEGQNETYLTSDLSAWELNTQLSNWIDTLYFTIPTADVFALTLENANGTFNFTKDAEGNWLLADIPEDKELNTTAVDSLATQATAIRISKPIGTDLQASFGLDNPQATITLKTQTEGGSQETHTLQVGATQGEENLYVFRASNSNYYVYISEFTGNNFVQKTLDDFVTDIQPAEDTN